MRWLPLLLLGALLGAAKPIPNKECMDCHGEVRLDQDRAHAHRGHPCVGCHEAVTAIPHPEALPPVRCGKCHRHEAEDFARSVHAVPVPAGPTHQPGCTTCHGKAHELRSPRDPKAPVSRQRLAATCGTCHEKALLDRVFTQLVHRRPKMGIRPGQLK